MHDHDKVVDNGDVVCLEVGSESEFELFPDLLDVGSPDTITLHQKQEGERAAGNKVGPVIKIKMQTDEDEKVLMEYLLGKSNHNVSPTIEVVKETPSYSQNESSNQGQTIVSCKETCAVEVTSTSRQSNLGNGSPISIADLQNDPSAGDSLNRNALNARLNRLKKKKHLEGLETSVKNLSSENAQLKCQAKTLSAKVEALETEVDYLKGVLANQSELASLLSNIGNTPGVRFHSSLPSGEKSKELQQRKRKADENGNNECSRRVTRAMKVAKTKTFDSDIGSESSKDSCQCDCEEPEIGAELVVPSKSDAAGVCLHVSNGAVTLEFCSRCNNVAKGARMDESAGRQK
ncbi:uncharacterized protein [Ptychodera flava]|uniref:uncharacterized protein n=1 Tax=Ptychodera flava TaxID=63121 RepID=UPI00396A4D71